MAPYAERDGVQIYYESLGEGPPLLLHASSGDHSIWTSAGYVDSLVSRYRVLLVDHRGQGRSDRPSAPGAYRIEEYREDVRAILDREQVPRVIFWGYSEGGKVGYAFADAYPDRVAALVDQDGLDWDLTSPEMAERRTSLAGRVRATGMRQLARRVAAGEGIPDTHGAVLSLLDTNDEGFARELEEWTEWPGPLSPMARYSGPLLALLNERVRSDDPEFLREVGRIAGPRAVLLRGLGTLGILTRIDLVLPHVEPFLASVREGT